LVAQSDFVACVVAIEAWILLAVSAAAGAAVGVRALPFPFLYVASFYVLRALQGAFTNHAGSDDNLAALGFLSALIWCALGVLAFVAGLVVRTVTRRLWHGLT
jgi:hypothetical protein